MLDGHELGLVGHLRSAGGNPPVDYIDIHYYTSKSSAS